MKPVVDCFNFLRFGDGTDELLPDLGAKAGALKKRAPQETEWSSNGEWFVSFW